MRTTLREYLPEHPEMQALWGTKNSDEHLDIPTGSDKKAWWICTECGHESLVGVGKKLKRPTICPICNGSQVFPGINDLTTKFPDIAKEWDSSNDKLASEVKFSSAYTAKWICSKNPEHKWTAKVAERTRSTNKATGCPKCGLVRLSMKKIAKRIEVSKQPKSRNKSPDMSIQLGYGGEEMRDYFHGVVKYPELKDTSYKSKLMCSWECSKGHKWEQKPIAFKGCPTCNLYEKSLGSTHPQLVQYWNDSEKTPFEVTPGSAYRAQWKCDNGHEYEAYVYAFVKSKNKGYSACPRCANQVSLAECQVADFVMSLGVSIETSVRSVISPYELDIYVPEKQVAIEFNGLHWHKEDYVGKLYHYNKWRSCRDVGVQLIQVWEDDWLFREGTVREMLQAKLGCAPSAGFGARETKVLKISNDDARAFLDKHHIQGGLNSGWRYGLYRDAELVSVMLFTVEGEKAYLTRFASSAAIPGAFTKLLKATVRELPAKVTRLVTFASHDVSDGKLYEMTGWKNEGELKPDYSYVVGNLREHKFNYRKKRFRDDPSLKYVDGLSESELASLNDISRIWDTGKTRYSLERSAV